MASERHALVIYPGHGSEWLSDVEDDGDDYIVGLAWDDSGRGSALMPDDFIGMPEHVRVPRRWVLRDSGDATHERA